MQGMDNAMWREGVCEAHGKVSCCHQGLPPAARAAPKGQLWSSPVGKRDQRLLEIVHDHDDAPVQVIADIARRMGHGMAEFIESEVMSVADYDRYCHYVAGLVGIGLSQVSIS